MEPATLTWEDVAHDLAEILHLVETDLFLLLFKLSLFDIFDYFPVQSGESGRKVQIVSWSGCKSPPQM